MTVKSDLKGTKKLTSTGEGVVARPEEHCYRCGYRWVPRRRRARICSRCKSPYYWLPRLRIPSYGGGEGIEEVIGPQRPEVLRIALRNGATDVRVFGSVARREATKSSDLDVLVQPVSAGAFRPIDLALDLSRLLGRRVDVVAEKSLHWLVEPQVVAEAVPLRNQISPSMSQTRLGP